MKYEEVKIEEFMFVGISIRTTNKDNKSLEDIGNLWHRFIENNIADLIPHKVSEDIYCMYTDYESDYIGEYTVVLGFKVSDTNDPTDEFYYKEIPASTYYKFEGVGTAHDVAGKTWEHIWKTDYQRRYLADFDVYDIDSITSDVALVSTYLSIKQ